MKIKITFIFFILLASLSLSGCIKKKNSLPYKMDLEIWGAFDDSGVFDKAIEGYVKANPQIREIKFRKLSSNFDDYEQQMLESMASGASPDVIYLKNTALTKHKNKITPLPTSEQYLRTFKNNFVDVAYGDFVEEDQIYATPLYCDTLSLYYNRAIFNQAGITSPPKTWDEVVENTKILTRIDEFGNINQSAIALGRSKNPASINRAGDIFMLMAMQKGANLNHDLNTPTSVDMTPGTSALTFFTDFSRGSSELYTWNTKMPYSVDAFRFGETAMMINYSYLNKRLRKSDPLLDFEIAPVPQFNPENNVNFANYWGLAVTKNKKIPSLENDSDATYTNEDRINEAWKFVLYLTLQPENKSTVDPAREYLTETGKPAARKDLIEEQKGDDFLEIFARQALTAKSWRQPNEQAVDEILNDMIDSVNTGALTPSKAIGTASGRINVLKK